MLPDNVTIADIVSDLAKPERYVRLALANMYAAENDCGPLVIRIGKMGTGQVPHYRFDAVEQHEVFDSPHTSYMPMHSFNGRNHKPLVPEGEESDILRDEHWSKGTMTRDELAALLGSIRSKGQRR